jgi:hypothetical protein
MEKNETVVRWYQEIENIAMDPEFIKIAANIAQQMGITAEEWNKNKVAYLLMWAKEVWKKDNKIVK